jgi:GNAT superfamily N-acetyltransferase
VAEVAGDREQPEQPLASPVPLTAAHDTSGFECGEPALDEWLRSRALKNEGRFSRTYVVCRGNRVVAYFCILAGAVDRADAPGAIRRNAPNAVPVSVIGRLAVDRREAGKGLGTDILSDALRRIAVASQSIGIGAVMVQAMSGNAKAFYQRHAEFLEYPAESRTLYLPIDTLIAAFS